MTHPLTSRLTLGRALLLATVLLLLLSGCATSRYPTARATAPSLAASGYVKDSNPAIWTSAHPAVRRFHKQYNTTRTVADGLGRGRRYLPGIIREFQKRNLPVELAYLPLLESRFMTRADSGSARGMWQFTAQTAEHMGLQVGAFVDERLNWMKATQAAADYLELLGQQFNWDWSLALAAYNGGPNYMEDAMRTQGTRDFFRLSLRQETAEYVPRFVAMLQVARERYGVQAIASR